MVNMDKYLAETMIANLLRNSIIHNEKGGEIDIVLSDQVLTITNSGNKLTFSKEDIFKRFSRSEYNKQSLGIGLSIVKRICDLYNFKINYHFSEKHIFNVYFR
jgi:signal transduction histidine kinase